MKWVCLVFLFAFPCCLEAQYRVAGKVLDAQNHKPVEGVDVILSGTTKGTVTGSTGEFQLAEVKAGKYDLVISSVNYEQYILPIAVGPRSEGLVIELKPAVTTLKEVVVEPYDEKGWDKYGPVFNDCFIGSDKLAEKVTLVNPEAVKFNYNSVTGRLRGFSHEKLILVNKALGYRISYWLSDFEYDYNNNTFSFKGHPLFEELRPSSEKERLRWEQLRQHTYEGSLRHFIRSLYAGRLAEEGFETRSVKPLSPGEIHRVKRLLANLHDRKNSGIVDNDPVDQDSMEYYLRVKSVGLGENELSSSHTIPADSLLSSSTEPNAKRCFFPDVLRVTYLKKRVPAEYSATLPAYRRNEWIRSELHLRFDSPILIYPDGNYFNGLNLVVEGFWSWSGKISTMLPGDYWPGK